MKSILFFLWLVFFSSIVCGQANDSSTGKVNHSVTNNRWDLNKYVWSHTQNDPVLPGKQVIDFDAIDNWPGLGEQFSISRNGLFFAYTIERGSIHYKKSDTLVVQSTMGSWRWAITEAKPGFFSGDSKQYIYEDQKGLCFLQTGSGERRYVKDVVGYTLPYNSRNDWFAYQLKDASSTVVLHNLISGKENRFTEVVSFGFDEKVQSFSCQLKNETKELIVYGLATEQENRYSNISAYVFSHDGNSLLLTSSNGNLDYIDLNVGRRITIWSPQDKASLSIGSYSLDKAGSQAVIVIKDQQSNENTIWYWKVGMDKAEMKVDKENSGIEDEFSIGGTVSLTDNGQYVQFVLQAKPDTRRSDPEAAQMDLWSYQDTLLQNTQQSQITKSTTYTAIFNLGSNQIMRLNSKNERLSDFIRGDYAIVSKNCCGERFWEKGYGMDSAWLVSLKKGTRQFLLSQNCGFSFSPDVRYLVYFDVEKGCNYFSYNLSTGKIINISAGTPAFQFGHRDYYLRTHENPDRFVGMTPYTAWIGGGGLIVYDDYDVWQLDITGKNKPVNITNGYGRAHHIKFELSGSGGPYRLYGNDTLLLKAFNRKTKYNGYYRIIIGRAGNPELLYMGPCFMERIMNINDLHGGTTPVKAADAHVWLVRRETATEGPNYFLTHDFKTYKQLSWLAPQKKYNWYTTELHSFKQLDGTFSQGVLYKPENFDPKKKYPVIISFYTYLSDNLYQYAPADYIVAPHLFDHPSWMVSHGYLVFVPDIYFTQGKWGPSTVNTMDGAAKYLRTLSYVEAKHLGAVGHSNSGRYAYYLLTHSELFAAMSVGAGATDMVSAGLSYDLYWAEVNIGLGSIWQNKETWLDHSAVLHADKVTSPLLLFHNIEDGAPVQSAKEMYTALRRLEKKCWWLQYDQGSHTLGVLKDLRDFTIRYTQYFDHYLKEAPAPRWMTHGIPASLKTIESRYELDPTGTCDLQDKKECKVCKRWNDQHSKHPEMFRRPISGWTLGDQPTFFDTATSKRPVVNKKK